MSCGPHGRRPTGTSECILRIAAETDAHVDQLIKQIGTDHSEEN
jgi:hypothetical protein